MKNVLVLIHDDLGQECRLQAALDLARALSGHLRCLEVVHIPLLVGTDYMLTSADVAVMADAEERAAKNRNRVQTRLGAEDVPWDWVNVSGEFAPALKEQSELADIIVLNTGDPDLPEMHATVSEVVVHTARPVLAVPTGTERVDFTKHVLIAWNGSTAVSNTVRAVAPLLALSEGVTLVEIGDIEEPPAEEAAAYLSRHGIHARVDRVDPGEASTEDRLLELLKDRQPGYCVLGAYGRSRLLESLFGGVTRTMLAQGPLPLILGH